MEIRKRYHRAALAILSGWLALSFACNMPVGSGDAPESPGGISKEELRQTLEAQAVATEQGAYPAPGLQFTPPAASPFEGMRTATPQEAVQRAPSAPGQGEAGPVFQYIAQAGDTLLALSGRFGVSPEQIISTAPISAEAFLPPGLVLEIPNVLGQSLYPSALLPDSEVIYSPSTVGFEIEGFIQQAGGYLNGFEETVNGEALSGAEIVRRIALESSINPRLLLAILESRSHWVYGQPEAHQDLRHPIGFYAPGYQGLYYELSFTATQLNIGYYGWREGTLTELKFRDPSSARVSPALNAGSVAIQHLFAKLYKQAPWREALYGPESFSLLYQQMFGDPWARAITVEPLFREGLAQPVIELPFQPGERWSYTGGPHASWNTGTPRGALDFSPVTGEPACSVSQAWVTASATGIVTRSERNVVAIDLDGDGHEGTGWVLVYLHLAERERIAAGTWVDLDMQLGHPSCERGKSTGTHVHIARKYNGEWLPADGPLPFSLSGWQARMGKRIYEGLLTKDGQVISANPGGSQTSIIVR